MSVFFFILTQLATQRWRGPHGGCFRGPCALGRPLIRGRGAPSPQPRHVLSQNNLKKKCPRERIKKNKSACWCSWDSLGLRVHSQGGCICRHLALLTAALHAAPTPCAGSVPSRGQGRRSRPSKVSAESGRRHPSFQNTWSPSQHLAATPGDVGGWGPTRSLLCGGTRCPAVSSQSGARAGRLQRLWPRGHREQGIFPLLWEADASPPDASPGGCSGLWGVPRAWDERPGGRPAGCSCPEAGWCHKMNYDGDGDFRTRCVSLLPEGFSDKRAREEREELSKSLRRPRPSDIQ